MTVCGINDNSLKKRFLRESELILLERISADSAAKETRKHAHEILQLNKTINQRNISKHSKSGN